MPEECIFCRIVVRQTPASIIAETEDALAFMDINQMTDGHVLIIPKKHVVDIFELDEETADAVYRLTVAVARAVKAALKPDGLNLWQSNGSAAQQEVFHFHNHVIARYRGDRDRIRVGWTPSFPSNAHLDALAETIAAAMQL